MSTIETLRNRLSTQKGEWPRLCSETGLTYWWLTKFAQGRIAEPGLSKIERLDAWLTTAEGTAPAPGAGRASEADLQQAA